MSIFNRYNINNFVDEFQQDENSVLLDVRTREEYEEEHIPESINVPLDEISIIANIVTDKSKKLYVYCRSGSRSGQALEPLKKLGYSNAVNIGGIIDYYGETVM
ncbi:MAG: rhodanese-like domain-containing protein [Ruminococcus sp.]|nr:rhodanese-like domain-containing protein [Candidatus Copronaster equi]